MEITDEVVEFCAMALFRRNNEAIAENAQKSRKAYWSDRQFSDLPVSAKQNWCAEARAVLEAYAYWESKQT